MKISPAQKRDVKTIFDRARLNNAPPRKLLEANFGRQFARAFSYSLEVLGSTGDRRENGHPSVVHSLQVAMRHAGFCNSYGSGLKRGRRIELDSPIVTPYDLIRMKSDDYFIQALCSAMAHDTVEDKSKSARELEQGFRDLKQAFSLFGNFFAIQVTRNVRLLTNRYARLLKQAQRHMPPIRKDPLDELDLDILRLKDLKRFLTYAFDVVQKHGLTESDGEVGSLAAMEAYCKTKLAELERRVPKKTNGKIKDCVLTIQSVRIGLERVRDGLADELDGDEQKVNLYAGLIGILLSDLKKLEDLKGNIGSGISASSYYTTTSSIAGVIEHLSFRAYNHFTRDILHAALRSFKSFDDNSDIPLLNKYCDGEDNVETTNVSNIYKIDRSYAKGEIVIRRIDSSDQRGQQRSLSRGSDGSLGWVQLMEQRDDVPQDYVDVWRGLGLDFKSLIIRSCMTRRAALAQIDAHSMSGELVPFLLDLEQKYRDMYGFTPEKDIFVARQNPVGKLWIQSANMLTQVE